ncbi:MAG: MFS transporter [Flavobacteriales bacterium]|nr:MFS transporter [Flavobacteriales bacterium]
MNKTKLFNAAVIVAALGYMVDIYDLVLFAIVRIGSLKSLGLSPEDIESKGLILLNIQMIGMLLGGIFWGILGDKKGRLSVLFGSIIMYSIANILNGMVQTIDQYYILRFIAGFGLAGELGAGITLVTELMSKENRGWGTTIVATVGVFGAVIAGMIYKASGSDWRLCYYIGGALGIVLLFLRIAVSESGMFGKIKQEAVAKGKISMLFSSRQRFIKYMRCILMGLPTWFTIGIIVSFSPEFAKLQGVEGVNDASVPVTMCYIGITLGDFLSGLLSQLFKTRKKIMIAFLLWSLGSFIWFYLIKDYTAEIYYLYFLLLGISVGFWAILITIAAESFGTNLRSTVATTVPNFVRGSLVLITLFYTSLQTQGIGKLQAVFITGTVCVLISLYMSWKSEETFGKDLDYVET